MPTKKNMKTVQFVYSKCFLEIYSLIDKRGINLKGEFLLTFKAWKDKNKFSAVVGEKQNENMADEMIEDEKKKLKMKLKTKN